MQLHVPTPCSAKRAMDDFLCYRFHKRLRIDAPGSDSPGAAAEAATAAAAAAAAAVAASGPPCTYGDMNSLLRQLHVEQLARRPLAASTGPMAEDAHEMTTSGFSRPALLDGHSIASAAADGAGGLAATNFSIADVVRCSHGSGGRCLQCSGRLVQNVSIPLYSAFCAAFNSLAPSASSSVPLGAIPSRAPAELSFPAIASLLSCLAPEPGDRLLHLGSGVGRMLVAWALMVPLGAASGIEACPSRHQEALAARGRLAPEVQGQVFMHCGDIFGVQGEWHQASMVLVSTTAFDESAVIRLAHGLQSVRAGTRIVALSRPLCADPRRAPPGFILARHAAYCTTGIGNCSAYIYRKAGEC
mmetsp:Transcript_12752/g.39976  ORF Transcript_12752/g.39976 Transcript_12752/m.39976 type:complete len:358 (-) Transcript_12752:266-1339(-)